ncbi:esterase family protein [Dysgonomonas sp. 521]|uniref:alpha/beta hydrolase n=1 Tax=Dysgonomonas sp. 521 TaxID=2302932 RepID=UPI0013D633E0|nr:alpha/beta hydrolase-fold protein [Dysgonomonas sp. 521]NDV94507.1 esterase family protein [Dysgonomonas sp. 521]
MRNIVLIFICSLAYTNSFAQKSLNIHKSDFTPESFLTSTIDSIRFTANETVMRIHFENFQSDYLLSEIDSITITNNDIPTEGTIDMSQTIPSQILGGNQSYTIYLPPSYNVSPNREYPILYLLHGLGQNYRSWETNGNMKAIADEAFAGGTCEEMIIVSPEAYASFYVNGYYQGMNYEDYFVNEFIPIIESTYRVKANKGGRSISGLSMGGYGCTYHAFSRPEMFSSCFAMSSAYTGTYTQVGTLVVGKTDEELANFPAFVMECGTEDWGALPMNDNVNNILSQTSLVYTYTTRPGRHDWAFWQECLPKALKLASDNFE